MEKNTIKLRSTKPSISQILTTFLTLHRFGWQLEQQFEKRLTETDGMYEYLVDYAKHENVDEEDRIELMVRNEYE